MRGFRATVSRGARRAAKKIRRFMRHFILCGGAGNRSSVAAASAPPPRAWSLAYPLPPPLCLVDRAALLELIPPAQRVSADTTRDQTGGTRPGLSGAASTPLPPVISSRPNARKSCASCGNLREALDLRASSSGDSAYESQENSVCSRALMRSLSCPQLQTSSFSSGPAPPSSPPSRRRQHVPFKVELEQRPSGVGLMLGKAVTEAVAIKHMAFFGSAAKDGTLRVGDHILEINRKSVVGKSVEEVRKILRWIPRRQSVTITAMAPPRDITPRRSPFFTGKLSIKLATSYSQSSGIEVEGGDSDPVIISHILPGSLADQCAVLRVGDSLLTVNGRSLTGASLKEAQTALRRHCLPLKMTVHCQSSVKTAAVITTDIPTATHSPVCQG